MTSASEIAAQLLSFTAVEFATAADLDTEERLDALLFSDFEGMAISAPMTQENSEALALGADLPVVLGYRMTGHRGWEIPISQNTVMVARNLLDGRVKLTDPFIVPGGHKRHSQDEAFVRDPMPPADQLPEEIAEITWIDGARFRLTARPGEWRLSLISYDWVSNELAYRVEGPQPELKPREVYVPKVADTRVGPELPQPPEMPGISLQAERLKGATGRIRVAGRLALPNRRHMTPATMEGEAPPDAVVSLTFVVLGQNAPRHTSRFGVPAKISNGTAQAEFVVDLGAPETPLPSGPLVLWGISDEVLVGPIYLDDAPDADR